MFLIHNIIIYLFLNLLFYQMIGPKYKYAFRLAEIFTLFFSILVSFLINFESLDKFLLCVISNFFLFYIFFHVFNMVQTSPRVKIISIIGLKKNIDQSALLNIYNYKNMIDNRLMRMKSSNQININSDFEIKLSKNSKISEFIYVILIIVKKYL